VVLRAGPQGYRGGLRAPGGGKWLVGQEEWADNPRHVVPPGYFHVVRLWFRCRAGMGGFAALPEPGGINQQPAWLMAAFAALENAEEELRKDRDSRG
jgi:hypothetical protein